MLQPYRAALATPGAKAFTAAAFVMRLPMSMLGIGIVLLVSRATGSYGVAGAVSAAFAVVQAATSPQLGRLVDRFGQARIIVPALAVHGAGIVLLVLSALRDAPTWTLYATAVVAGAAFVPAGSLVRARWSGALDDPALLPTAYAWESVLDEAVFVVGPVGVTLVATRLSPGIALVSTLAFVTAGTLALARQRATEPRLGRAQAGGSALRAAALQVLAGAFVFVGGIFGSVEVAVIAFTAERDQPAAAGVVLALWAAGSMVSGIVYGARAWRAPLRLRFLVAVTALAVAVSLFPLAGSVVAMAALAVVAGVAISPTLISGFGLVEALAPAGSLTEGLGWVSTGLGVGVALGATVVGQVIDAYGARTGFVVALASGAAAVLVAVAGSRALHAPGAARRA